MWDEDFDFDFDFDFRDDSELKKHKTSDKIKWIATGIAFILVAVMLVGLCLQVFGTGKAKPTEWFKSSETMPVDGTAFEVAPVNETSAMSVSVYSAETYSDIPLVENERILKVDTGDYAGNINWAIEYTGGVVYWGEYSWLATDSVKITKINDRAYKLTCLKPFGQQIKLTASLADFSDVTATCICDYTQRHYFSELVVGFNSFLADGTVARAPTEGIGEILSPSLLADGNASLKTFVIYNSTPCTKLVPLTPVKGLTIELKANDTWIEELALEDYKFKSYSCNFDNSLSGTLSGYFDKSWFEYGVSENGKTADDFARELTSKVGLDSNPAYTLTITGLPETTQSCYYDVYLDIYDLYDYVDALDMQGGVE